MNGIYTVKHQHSLSATPVTFKMFKFNQNNHFCEGFFFFFGQEFSDNCEITFSSDCSPFRCYMPEMCNKIFYILFLLSRLGSLSGFLLLLLFICFPHELVVNVLVKYWAKFRLAAVFCSASVGNTGTSDRSEVLVYDQGVTDRSSYYTTFTWR